ncbi:HTH-type transcriptional regulator MalR [Thermobispora bispora]|jgi:DNA-binding LacI/PurR family transcriptional regulator|uniref:Transcriptional regulator, LacI family n=1 Tax=Thermobispora bispora (strain ATCC 19993 / DSM 43833 / CBS 139.67 / JCM 10125 / KCTC 9307 / NBRC 14880 / R51) TaxID=469371 RepID=D6YBN4_THEBD|nr:LacI family DNA-binding transcriptional regulator [Thermobispora bispora]MBO2475000.1 LacI family transcriptional regulator [Actinomycetales bacterium]MDI9579157.1 LacI family DNA-binding transcriptional regulator [Thermobispora sp.]ADG88594.1 transcriptional regulator, LacI family [Thermobispora bispora DSM 43833]MBX6166692.1 LacI family DNA-binding transcriptional regulator [Thermobispora bispora]QSI48382.1 LacI family transcriptional regulator [Thermobispora bispora]
MSTIRLADIAAQAGVSEATVSRVLNGRPGVSPATRQAVLAALDVMGYERPQRLRQHSNGLIGLVIPELSNPIFPAFAQAVERALTQRGYTPVLCTQEPGGATEDEFTEMLLDRGVSGIVFVSGRHADTTARMDRYLRLIDRGVPIVLVDGYNAAVPAPFISPDDRLAARLAVQHLVDLGHERIGLAVGQRRFVPVIRKIEGFRQTMAELLGVTDADELIQDSLFTVEGGQAAASVLIDRGCTGIVCASDLMALGAIRAVRERGLSVPGDVSVVGFDDSPLMAFTDPPLTTVRKPIGAMAAAAVETLLEEIAGTPARHVELVYRPELVVRGSTGSGPLVNRAHG